ncbi:hypothetical protein [Burkholderia glumae]|uniref:hypothetical protein n=1 Tax=Burkholderia glumae TaxID=337 RepID=UPI0021511DF5|nr:hypothetical protein [Burkholderia glumae]
MKKNFTLCLLLSAMPLSGCTADQIAQYKQQRVQDQIARTRLNNEKPVSDQGRPSIASQTITVPYDTRYQFAPPGQKAPTSRPTAESKPAYSGPHNYSIRRGNTYGYTSSESGQVHFFRYDGMRDGRYILISFEDTTASMVSCEETCKIARITGYGFDRTYEVKRNSVLANVIQDMLRGALAPSQ